MDVCVLASAGVDVCVLVSAVVDFLYFDFSCCILAFWLQTLSTFVSGLHLLYTFVFRLDLIIFQLL